jgi:hypothetical protein
VKKLGILRETNKALGPRPDAARRTVLLVRPCLGYNAAGGSPLVGLLAGATCCVLFLQFKAMFRYPTLPTKFTIQNFYSPSRQNAGTYMKY